MDFKDISFTSFFILIDDEPINKHFFYKAFPLNETFRKTVGSTNYSIDISEESEFAKLYIEFGNPLPRPDKVITVDTHELQENPRALNQYEPKQEFAIIDFEKSILWISYTRHKTFFTEAFKEAFDTQNVLLKNVYSEEDFLNVIKKVDEIKLSALPSLFSDTFTLSKELVADMQGYGATFATLIMRFKDASVLERMKNKIKELFNKKVAYKSLVITGRDENNVSVIFNNDFLQRKIPIKALVSDAGIFDQNVVFSQVLSWLKNDKKNNS